MGRYFPCTFGTREGIFSHVWDPSLRWGRWGWCLLWPISENFDFSVVAKGVYDVGVLLHECVYIYIYLCICIHTDTKIHRYMHAYMRTCFNRSHFFRKKTRVVEQHHDLFLPAICFGIALASPERLLNTGASRFRPLLLGGLHRAPSKRWNWGSPVEKRENSRSHL